MALRRTARAIREDLEGLKAELRAISLQPTWGSSRDLSLRFDKTPEQLTAEIQSLREELAAITPRGR